MLALIPKEEILLTFDV